MAAPKFLYRIANGYQNAAAAIVGGIAAAANMIVATGSDGFIDDSFIHPALVPKPIVLPATQALAAGSQVNIYSNSGTESVRLADATTSPPQRADGFVTAAVASGANATVYRRGGVNTGVSGLTVGSDYYLGAGGAVTATQNTTSAQLDQFIGTATSATTLDQPPFQVPVLNT